MPNNSKAEVEAKREKVLAYLAAHGPSRAVDIQKRTKASTAMLGNMRKQGMVALDYTPNGRGSGKAGGTWKWRLPSKDDTNGNGAMREPSLREKLSQTQRIASASETLFGKGGPKDYSVYLAWVDLTKEMM
jgi:plasmid stabilization system protein ParE